MIKYNEKNIIIKNKNNFVINFIKWPIKFVKNKFDTYWPIKLIAKFFKQTYHFESLFFLKIKN